MPIRNLLVTGANGFVGRHMLNALARELPDVLVHQPEFDITEPESVENVVKTTKPDVCLHLAAVSTIPAARQNASQAWAVNLFGTLSLARALLSHAPGCRLVFVSSADAYGLTFSAGHPVDETMPLAPMNTYGATKAASDLALGALVGEGLQVIRLRPFNHTGPGQSTDFVVPAFARQLARLELGLQPPEIHVGSLEPQRDFLDVRDVCSAYIACLQRIDDIANGSIINICSGHPRSIESILQALLSFVRSPVTVITDSSRLRENEIPYAVGNPALAERLLGWRPAIQWETTLLDVMTDWRIKASTS